MEPSAEEQLVAARQISPLSEQSQPSPPTPTKKPYVIFLVAFIVLGMVGTFVYFSPLKSRLVNTLSPNTPTPTKTNSATNAIKDFTSTPSSTTTSSQSLPTPPNNLGSLLSPPASKKTGVLNENNRVGLIQLPKVQDPQVGEVGAWSQLPPQLSFFKEVANGQKSFPWFPTSSTLLTRITPGKEESWVTILVCCQSF